MYLKSIEIQGFKSFANKILFEFHNGITGIVGPNGSGKSNVADAVRWVLGEQRAKQLRGSNMQDVIFSGTEMKKPQGFAYVAITLDNSDHQLPIEYEEVTISRRVYRSGESEYLINKSPCRLKDINELFYDTGIGKEGYSIIGQGQIDKILSGKPEERRELFDEAAGIVKFKRRKVLAQKKLEDEKQNLVRVADILNELEKQVGPLAKQSETAREYLRLKEELKLYDANLFLLETAGIRTQLADVEEREKVVMGDFSETQEKSAVLKEEYEELDHSLSILDKKITADREAAGKSDVLKGSLEGQINVLNEQINTEKMNADHIKSRMDVIVSELLEKEGQREQYDAEKDGLSHQVHEAMEQLSEAEENLSMEDSNIKSLDQKIEDGKSAMIAILNERAGVSARQQRYETMLEQVDVRRSEVCQKLLKFKSDESVQEEQLKIKEKELSEIDEQLTELSCTHQRLEDEVHQSEGDLQRLNKNLSNKQQDYHTTANRLESLRNLAERYEGYGNSIRKVMEVKDRVLGIYGVVADLITASKKYEIAIETALGGSIQNIVTDSEQTAKQLIEHLKKNKFGRATFLPLSSIGNRGGFTQTAALKEPGVLGLASDLVETDKQYQGLNQYLLGRVVVTDTIDHAIALSKKFNYSLKIVTLEGELLNAGGSMTGGAFKNTSNLLGRKRELEELEASCVRYLKEVEEIEKDLVLSEAVFEDRKDQLNQIENQLQEVKLNQNTVRMGISQMEGKKQEIIESASDLTSENQQLESQIREIKENRQQLEAEIARLEELNQEKNRMVEEALKELESSKLSREEMAKNLSAIQLEASGLQQKNNFIDENIKRIAEEMKKLVDEKEGLIQGTDDTNLIIEGKRLEILELQKQIEAIHMGNHDLEALISSQLEEKEKLSKQQKEFFAKREELTERSSNLDKELFRLQNQKDKLSEKLESSTNYMWNEYEMTYSSAEVLRDEVFTSVSELKKSIEGLKSNIRSLGHVNVNAIEDYKEVSERYEFLRTQHDDLVEAEKVLLDIIAELDSGMRKQFEEKFRDIRREFDKVFRELFGGGHGTLELQEDEDILEAGIQIISQPPGKKLQNMMQLSGGEKALTAISLLFAIQNLKPSPFCLLDEIEAALDDSNVDRFANYLHKLTSNTQFIVITHRRGTMVASDRLYGITMQEKGVSTLVSVNLIENELDK